MPRPSCCWPANRGFPHSISMRLLEQQRPLERGLPTALRPSPARGSEPVPAQVMVRTRSSLPLRERLPEQLPVLAQVRPSLLALRPQGSLPRLLPARALALQLVQESPPPVLARA